MAKPILYTNEGEVVLPTKWKICSYCSGAGKSSAHLGAFTSDDMRDMDEDFMDDYMGGHYDHSCENCAGTGKIEVADHSRMTKAQLSDYQNQLADERATAEMERMERLCGA